MIMRIALNAFNHPAPQSKEHTELEEQLQPTIDRIKTLVNQHDEGLIANSELILQVLQETNA